MFVCSATVWVFLACLCICVVVQFGVRYWQCPCHEILFVSMVTIDVKISDFHFSKKVFICLCNSPVLFDFLKLGMIQECLKHPRGHLLFLQNKIFKIVRYKCVKNSLQQIIFLNCHTLHWITHFGCQIAKQFGNPVASPTRIKIMT